MNNMELWNKVSTPNPKYTKEFNRGGGFKGTATNTQYAIMRATELWGPNGKGWGLVINHEKFIEGAPIVIDGGKVCNEIIHIVRGFVWYLDADGKRIETSEQYGQTTFVGKNKYGPFTDEEAPKKSVTDLMLKCMSLLGFSADIFLGLWDDNKYVNDVRRKFDNDGSNGQEPDKKTHPGKTDSQNTKEDRDDPNLQKWLDWVDSFTGKTFDLFISEWDKYKKSVDTMPELARNKVNTAANEMKTYLMEKENERINTTTDQG